jgi:hypothetical protein
MLKGVKTNLLKNNFTLGHRVKYYNYVTHALDKIKLESCIEPKIFIQKDKTTYNGYTINNIIDLEKRIGTKSVYGVIYRTSVKNMLGRAPIAAKLMPTTRSNVNEIKINGLAGYLLRKQISRHFLFTYKCFTCYKPSSNLPEIVSHEKYFTVLNELAHGDLCGLCENNDFLKNDELVANIFCQVILSIATFHQLGYVHQDCHWGNFLYHRTVDQTGYYHYRILGTDYFLKNCGYTMMIYDFGQAEEIKDQLGYKSSNISDILELLISDYRRISYAFRNKNHLGWNKTDTLPNDKISSFVRNFANSLRMNKSYKNEDEVLSRTILPTLLNIPYANMFTRSLPLGERIVNSSPFLIDEDIFYVLSSR